MGEDQEKSVTITLRVTPDEKRMAKVVAAEMQKPMREIIMDYIKGRYSIVMDRDMIEFGDETIPIAGFLSEFSRAMESLENLERHFDDEKLLSQFGMCLDLISARHYDPEKVAAIVDARDFTRLSMEKVRECLRYCDRSERFCNGSWIGYAWDGTFRLIFSRIAELLLEEHKVSGHIRSQLEDFIRGTSTAKSRERLPDSLLMKHSPPPFMNSDGSWMGQSDRETNEGTVQRDDERG